VIGRQESWLSTDGRIQVLWMEGDEHSRFGFDGTDFWQQAVGETKKLTLIEAKTTPQIIQALTIVAGHQANPFGIFGTRSLDGSDKAQNRLACRLKFLDAKQDWFYCWVSLYDDSGRPEFRPLKVSSNLHEQTRGASVTFADWTSCDGVYVPRRRAFVSGFDERSDLEIRMGSCEIQTDVADTQFQRPHEERPAP
jgi:hypothetical protein